MILYDTPQDMQDKVEEYFDWCFTFEIRDGRRVRKCLNPPTFSGLARYLGFSSRLELLSYTNKKKKSFEDVINDAKLRIEDFYEGRLVMNHGPSTGIQFALKNNCGWEDTSKQQITGGSGDKSLVFAWGIDETQKVMDSKIAGKNTKKIAKTVELPTKKQPVKDAEIVEDVKDDNGNNVITMGDYSFE